MPFWNTWTSLTSTENAVEVYFDSAHHPIEKVRPGEDVPSVGHMRGWAAAGQDLNLQYSQRRWWVGKSLFVSVYTFKVKLRQLTLNHAELINNLFTCCGVRTRSQMLSWLREPTKDSTGLKPSPLWSWSWPNTRAPPAAEDKEHWG